MKRSKIYLQEDVLEKILLRLPVKSLMQCRCVCKSWYRIIGSSAFIRETISNTDNLYLLSTYKDCYTLNRVDGLSTDDKNIHYLPELFGIDENCSSGVQVYGSCNGLLCVSDTTLHTNSIIYLCNPIIRKVKRILAVPFEVHDLMEDEPMENVEFFFGYYADDAGMSFGYFDDDYKVIRIAEFFGMYRIGVYSLSTDSWKIIYCDSDYGKFKLLSDPSSKCVNGVAYFVIYKGRLVCFDLHSERIREVDFPGNCNLDCSKLEVYGESIALMETSDEHLAKWELIFSGPTNAFTWEKKVIVEFHPDINLYPIGFTIDGMYLLRDHDFYLCDLDISRLEEYTGDMVSRKLLAINYLVGNLVLLHEETLDPIAQTEPDSSTRPSQIVLHRGIRSRTKSSPSLDYDQS